MSSHRTVNPRPANRPVPYSTTVHVRDHCLCLHIQRAARAVGRHFDEVLRPVNLTNGQFSLLMSLNRPTSAPMAEVAALLAIDRTTLTAALKPLARRGLVRIAPDPEDGRARLLTLTPRGERLVAKATPLWTHHHSAIERELPSADELRAALHTLAAVPAVTASPSAKPRPRRTRRTPA